MPAGITAVLASMRPPAKQAENPRQHGLRDRKPQRFNEAACKTGGKLILVVGEGVLERASMRPPAKQAENAQRGRLAGAPPPASMRPPAKQAENSPRRR